MIGFLKMTLLTASLAFVVAIALMFCLAFLGLPELVNIPIALGVFFAADITFTLQYIACLLRVRSLK